MECYPDVNGSGFFEQYRAESVLASLEDAPEDYRRPPALRLDRISTLIDYSRNALTAADFGDALPTASLSRNAAELAETVLGISAVESSKQGVLLRKNIEFLRSFRVEDVSPTEWTPELVFAAAIKLIPEHFFGDPKLPLVLLVLPLWIKAGGQTGNILSGNEEGYVDSIVRGWLLRCTRRDGSQDLPELPVDDEVSSRNWRRYIRPKLPRKPRKKFSYIKKNTETSFKVMSIDEGIIDATLTGTALLNHVVEVLNRVAYSGRIPHRPRGRIEAAAKRLANVTSTMEYRSIAAQLTLRNCESSLAPDPRTLLSGGEGPMNVMLLIWLCARRNIPTIITLPRHQMCAFNSTSLWWNCLKKAHLPATAMLGFASHVWTALIRDSGTVGSDDAETTIESIIASVSVRPNQRMRDECMRLLFCTNVADALSEVDSMMRHVTILAGRIHTAINYLRETRLLREDILAHSADAWNAVMGCVRLCAAMAALLGCPSEAAHFLQSHRLIANHFAPDIYPWAHALSLCNKCLQGFAVFGKGKMRKQKVQLIALEDSSPDGSFAPFLAEFRAPASIRFYKRLSIPSVSNFCGATLVDSRMEGGEKVYRYQVQLGPEKIKRRFESEFRDRSRSFSGSEREDSGEDDDGMEIDESSPVPEYGVFGFGARAAAAAATAAAPAEPVVRQMVTTVVKGTVFEADVNFDTRVVTDEFYNNAKENLIRNLNAPLKEYVLRLIHNSTSPSIPASVKAATTIEAFIAAWDLAFSTAFDSSECIITEEEIEAVMRGHTRPPCTDTLDIDAADFAGEVKRFNRTEILRLMCCLTPGGREVIRFRGISDLPSAVSAVWAALRGVNDIDWMRRPKATLRKE
jgi:hypothetical protein